MSRESGTQVGQEHGAPARLRHDPSLSVAASKWQALGVVDLLPHGVQHSFGALDEGIWEVGLVPWAHQPAPEPLDGWAGWDRRTSSPSLVSGSTSTGSSPRRKPEFVKGCGLRVRRHHLPRHREHGAVLPGLADRQGGGLTQAEREEWRVTPPPCSTRPL